MIDKFKSKEWWKQIADRVIKTVAETAITTIGLNAVVLTDVNWVYVLSASGLSAVLSFLINLISLKVPDEPNLLKLPEDR